MIKIDVISGFLGAGKTTLIKKLFQSRLKDEKVVLIENEFGEIGVDGSFLKESGVEIKEINSGCICCSLVGDFSKSMKEIVEKFNPDRIIIEPSGVGKLSDIIKAIEKVEEPLKINIVATVVDGGKCKMYFKNFGEFYDDQIKQANTIVVSKTDKLSDEKVLAAVELIKSLNEHATIVTTPVTELDPNKLLGILEGDVSNVDALLKSLEIEHDDDDEECCCHHHHHDDDDDDEEEHEHHHHHDHDEDCCCGHHHEHDHDEHEHHHHHHDHDDHCCCDHDHEGHHHADDVFESVGIETPKKFTKEKIEKALEALEDKDEYGFILRAKGIVEAEDGQWIHFDYVPGEPDVRTGASGVTGRLCVIGSEIDRDKILKLFEI